MLDSGRDQAHTQLILGRMAEVCEIAWIQGHDLYATSLDRLLSGFEYTAKYNIGNDRAVHGPGLLPGQVNPSPPSSAASSAPSTRWSTTITSSAGSVATPWTYAAIQPIRPEGAAFQCDHVGFGTLLFTL